MLTLYQIYLKTFSARLILKSVKFSRKVTKFTKWRGISFLFSFLFKKTRFKKRCTQNQKGQVIVEYILLLVVSTTLALLLINLVTVDPGKNSPVFGYWKKIIEVIGADIST